MQGQNYDMKPVQNNHSKNYNITDEIKYSTHMFWRVGCSSSPVSLFIEYFNSSLHSTYLTIQHLLFDWRLKWFISSSTFFFLLKWSRSTCSVPNCPPFHSKTSYCLQKWERALIKSSRHVSRWFLNTKWPNKIKIRHQN